MAILRVLPFATISEFSSEGVQLEAWKLNGKEFGNLTVASLSEFDPTHVQNFTRIARISPGEAAREALQGKKAEFALVAETRSSHTGLRSTFEICSFKSTDARFTQEIEIDLENCETGGRIQLCTKVVLVVADPVESISASEVGSIVFSEEKYLDVEAYYEDFPHLEPAQLNGHLNLNPGPIWIVEIDASNLDVHATQALNVSVNAESAVGLGLLNGKKEYIPLRGAMMVDICRQLINAALDSPDFETEFAEKGHRSFSANPNSIGGFMYSTLLLCGFVESLAECRLMREIRPMEFEARIHNHVYEVARV